MQCRAMIAVVEPLYCSTGLYVFLFLHVFVMPTPAHSKPGHGLGNRAALLRHTTICYLRVRFTLVLPTPSHRGKGAFWVILQRLVAQDYVICLFFGGLKFRLAPHRRGGGATLGFRFSVDAFPPPPPFQVTWRWFSLKVFLLFG